MSILDIILWLPILACVAIGMGWAPARLTALGVSIFNVLLTAIAVIVYDRSGAEGFGLTASRVLLENPKLAYAVGVDGLSLIMLILSTVVCLCAVLFSPEVKEKANLYFSCVLLIAAGAIGAFISTDLFFFFAFHELALIPTFFMIGIFGKGEDRMAVAWKITIYLAFGSIILLAGLIALYSGLSGATTFDMIELQALAEQGALSDSYQKWTFVTLLIGFGVLISLFPFHSWAAPAYAAAPTPVAMLHAGVLKKFGLYGLLRVAAPMLPSGAAQCVELVCWLLLGNILFIGFVTIASKKLDIMLANSSVMHMGYIFLGIISLNAIGFTGAIILMFAHGISIALLFGLSSKIEESTGTLEFSKLGGLGKVAPFLGLMFGMAAFASAGLPGFGNFSGEVLVFFGAFKDLVASSSKRLDFLQITCILALWGVVISAVYMLRAFRHIFKGEPAEGFEMPDLSGQAKIATIILVAMLVISGFLPKIFRELTEKNLAVPEFAVQETAESVINAVTKTSE